MTPVTLIPEESRVAAVPTLMVVMVETPTVISGVPVSPCALVASVAVDAVPVTFPVTFPVTLPVKFPVTVPTVMLGVPERPVALPVTLPVTFPVTLPAKLTAVTIPKKFTSPVTPLKVRPVPTRNVAIYKYTPF